MRLAICVPTAGTCKSTFAYALAHSIGWFAKWEQTEDITLLMQESSVVHSNREALVDRALKWGATHILFTDDDMYWPPKAVLSLISRDLPFVVANYPKRTYPIEMTAVDVEGKRLQMTKESTGVEEIQFAGFGLALIRAEVFNALEKPWFLPGWMPENADYTTEDAPLYIRARSVGMIPYCDHDASKMDIGHVGLHTFAWDHIAEIVPNA